MTENTSPPLRPHVAILALIVVASAVAWAWPEQLLSLPLRCATQTLFDLRCPFCGLTHDFVQMLHGHAPTHNLFAWPVAITIYGVYPMAVAYAWRTKQSQIFYHRFLYQFLAMTLTIMFIANNWF